MNLVQGFYILLIVYVILTKTNKYWHFNIINLGSYSIMNLTRSFHIILVICVILTETGEYWRFKIINMGSSIQQRYSRVTARSTNHRQQSSQLPASGTSYTISIHITALKAR